MMPTQWDDLAETAADSITGMTNAAFDALLGDKASYHAASAYAAGIVITHAMASSDSSARIEMLPSLITNLPAFDTFYGTLSWYANGSPTKEMFTMQEQADVHQIVAPADASTADLSTDLADCLHWVVSASTRCVGLYAPFFVGSLHVPTSYMFLNGVMQRHLVFHHVRGSRNAHHDVHVAACAAACAGNGKPRLG